MLYVFSLGGEPYYVLRKENENYIIVAHLSVYASGKIGRRYITDHGLLEPIVNPNDILKELL